MQEFSFYVFFSFMILSLAYTDVYNIDDREGFGRRFDGIGGISGGGVNFILSLQNGVSVT